MEALSKYACIGTNTPSWIKAWINARTAQFSTVKVRGVEMNVLFSVISVAVIEFENYSIINFLHTLANPDFTNISLSNIWFFNLELYPEKVE